MYLLVASLSAVSVFFCLFLECGTNCMALMYTSSFFCSAVGHFLSVLALSYLIVVLLAF